MSGRRGRTGTWASLGQRAKLTVAGPPSPAPCSWPARPFPLGPVALILRMSPVGGNWAEAWTQGQCSGRPIPGKQGGQAFSLLLCKYCTYIKYLLSCPLIKKFADPCNKANSFSRKKNFFFLCESNLCESLIVDISFRA